MKVYDIDDGFCYRQIHSVVADNMAQAERIYIAKYKSRIIRKIELHSEYVLVQGLDEPQIGEKYSSTVELGEVSTKECAI